LDRARKTFPVEWVNAHADYEGARAYAGEGRLDEALRIYDGILSSYSEVLRHPRNRCFYEAFQTERGLALAADGRAKDALPLLEEALTYEVTEDRKGVILYNLGLCFQITKQDQKATSAFEQARKLCTDSKSLLGARYSLGVRYAKEGALGKALKELEWCEQNFVEGDVPKEYVYGWLVKVLCAAGKRGQVRYFLFFLGHIDAFAPISLDLPRRQA
jgi:tetratricopeptide (TPR) repeat protein